MLFHSKAYHREKKLSSPTKTMQSHLFSWVWESAQLLRWKTGSTEELILASEKAHFNPPASIPVTTGAWVRCMEMGYAFARAMNSYLLNPKSKLKSIHKLPEVASTTDTTEIQE